VKASFGADGIDSNPENESNPDPNPNPTQPLYVRSPFDCV